MTPEARTDIEARAERCVRRGEMQEALALYQQLLAGDPGDEALKRRVAQLQETLQPMELQAGARVAEPAATRELHTGTPEQEGERLFALGDYAGAAAAYRRALKDKPHSELIQERLVELFRLAQASPRNSPTDRDLPREPEPLLRALLDRIAARKRLGITS